MYFQIFLTSGTQNVYFALESDFIIKFASKYVSIENLYIRNIYHSIKMKVQEIYRIKEKCVLSNLHIPFNKNRQNDRHWKNI